MGIVKDSDEAETFDPTRFSVTQEMKTANQQCPYTVVDNLAIGDAILMFIQQAQSGGRN